MNKNYASLYIYITDCPDIKIENGEDGCERIRAVLLSGLSSRIPHKGPDGEVESYQWDRPLIFTSDRNFIRNYLFRPGTESPEDRAIVHKGDMVIVEGKIQAKKNKRKYTCPECGEVYIHEGLSVYIEPAYLLVCRQELQEDEAVKELIKANESSNIVHMSGIVSEDPEFMERAGRDSACLTIRMDPDEDGHKLPLVKVFGKRAKAYGDMVWEDSEIYVNGALQSRIGSIEVDCGMCGTTFVVQTVETVLVPYRIEPVRYCVVPEKDSE